MLKKVIVLCGLLLACLQPARSQDNISGTELMRIKLMEDSLVTMADSMYLGYLPETRQDYSEQFARQLVRALKVTNSWSYPFDKLNQKINILLPDDKAFRIFNWAIAPTDQTRRYFGAIQLPSEQLKLYGLVDYSTELTKGLEDSVFAGGKWLGCLYYRIITEEVNDQKVYTLFGLNASSIASNKKILDPMTLTASGPVFGAPIFNVRSENFPSQRINRFVLEYKKDVQVSMNWDNDRRAIFFDKLISQVNDPGRKYTYVPSGQVDGFRWNGSQWDYVRDLVPVVPLKDGEAPVGQEKQ